MLPFRSTAARATAPRTPRRVGWGTAGARVSARSAECPSAGRSASPGPARQAGRRHARGFSLLEVLVAFVILALVAGALFELFGGALRNAGAAGEWTRAL